MDSKPDREYVCWHETHGEGYNFKFTQYWA